MVENTAVGMVVVVVAVVEEGRGGGEAAVVVVDVVVVGGGECHLERGRRKKEKHKDQDIPGRVKTPSHPREMLCKSEARLKRTAQEKGATVRR